MLNITTIQNLLSDKFNKVQFIKAEGETYIYEYEVTEDQYATIVVNTEGCECEEDALNYFETKYVFIGQYDENEFIVETKVTEYVEGNEFKVNLDEVKSYKRVKSAYEFAVNLAKKMDASFNGVACMY